MSHQKIVKTKTLAKIKTAACAFGVFGAISLFQNCAGYDAASAKNGGPVDLDTNSQTASVVNTPTALAPAPVGIASSTIVTPASFSSVTSTVNASPEINQTQGIAIAIGSLYRLYLGRVASAVEIKFYVEQIQNGRSLAQVEVELYSSNEAAIRGYYLQHLLREPEKAGMVYWMNAVAQGQSLMQVRDNIRRSSECKVDCILSALALVTSFYHDLLGRAPDLGGQRYYVDQINSGRDPLAVREEIRQSPEARIRGFYRTHLLREPDPAGLQYWLDSYNKGQTLAQIQTNVRLSSECRVLCL